MKEKDKLKVILSEDVKLYLTDKKPALKNLYMVPNDAADYSTIDRGILERQNRKGRLKKYRFSDGIRAFAVVDVQKEMKERGREITAP